MNVKEAGYPVRVNLFDGSDQFKNFLQSHNMGIGYGTGAKGILNSDGSIDVAINRAFFRSGGIPDNQLNAIAKHEKIELTSKAPDESARHLEATIGEYQEIFDNFGEAGLREYHAKLCNLYGGLNDTRNSALKTILGIKS